MEDVFILVSLGETIHDVLGYRHGLNWSHVGKNTQRTSLVRTIKFAPEGRATASSTDAFKIPNSVLSHSEDGQTVAWPPKRSVKANAKRLFGEPCGKWRIKPTWTAVHPERLRLGP